MKISTPRLPRQGWPRSYGIALHIDTEEEGLAQAWTERCADDLQCFFDDGSARTPHELFHRAADAARRWLRYQLGDRKLRGMQVPKVLSFEVEFFPGPAQRGTPFAVIDVLSGKVKRR